MSLTEIECKNSKPRTKIYKLTDNKGLYLEIHPNGSKYWRYKYRIAGKEKRLAIGVYPEISLKQAREKHDDARIKVRDGIDPSAEKQTAKQQIRFGQEKTLKVVALDWMEKQKTRWTPKHWRSTMTRLETNIFPALGHRPIKEIKPLELLDVARKICGALRRSELVAVRAEDLEFTAQGIILTLPRSKTDQLGQGRKIGIPKGRGRLCPVQSVTDWITHLGADKGVIFRSITKGGVISTAPLSDRAVADIIKHYAKKAGLPPERYSGHSLRCGLATSAAQHGISSWVIRKQTGHKSEMMLARYIREGDLFTNNAANLF